MTVLLDTREFDVRDRADVVRQTIASTVVHVEIDFPRQQGPASVLGAITDLGPMRICSVRSNATLVERTPTLARDDLEPRIFLALQLAGSSLIVQDGRESVLHPGELAFSDSTSPYSLIDIEGIRQHFFSIPVSALALPQDAIRRLAAVNLSAGNPVADLTASHLGRLASRPDIFDGPGAEAVGFPSVELVRALLSTQLDKPGITSDSMQSTLQVRILHYVRAHLSDPQLNAGQIATVHNISVRQLYNVLAAGGISLGEWIRHRRLEACRLELSRRESRLTTIEAVARRWGFGDPSSFGRSFRAAYGMSPREWRDHTPHP